MEFSDVLANTQKRVVHHSPVLIVHTDTNGHFHIATAFHLDEKVITIVLPAILKIVGVSSWNIVFFKMFILKLLNLYG